MKASQRFSKPMDSELHTEANTVIHATRVTLAEFFIVRALHKYETDVDTAVAEVNDQVRVFSPANIKPTKDLHKSVWKFASQMTRGVALT